ncbi:helix-turn-helix domain-containing protein [Enterococcus sp. DIV0242_7C1]|uniref:Mga helix-turn-helix domain-containing protein n=1 Tax=Candidatus Enterococcus dunnyi TaxID=1834192 RepID=A0AAQ3W6M5_9ENTE|nr:helix-turn-helix domain-containing protein [Enterococcus sp. DIV0242_7C1]MBO0471751.1 helix-turn-helix domain-containing protein [Enterococcus sp. DIV0242_7C1]
MELGSIIDNFTKRKLLLLEQLKTADDFVSIQELITTTHWERKTILKYLDALAEDCSSFSSDEIVLIKAEQAIILSYSTYKSYRSLYLSIINHSLPIKLLQDLLLGDSVSIGRCLNEYFISESTLKRQLKKLNQLLSTYYLKIAQKKGVFILIGAEHQIRIFAYTFFWLLYRGKGWPFTAVAEQKITDLLDYMEEFSRPWNHSKHRQLHYILALNLIRYRKSFKIQLSKEQLHTYFSQAYLDTPRGWLNRFNYPESEILFFFILSQSHENFLSVPSFKKEILTFHRATHTEVFESTEQFFDLFSEQIIPLSEEEREKSYISIFANHLFCSVFPAFPEEMTGFTNASQFSEQFPVLFKKLANMVEQLERQTQFSLFKNKDFLIPNYALLFASLTDITSFESEITVCFDTDYPILMEKRIMDIFESYFGRSFNLTIFFKIDVLDTKFDLLLTSSFIPCFDEMATYTIYIPDRLRAQEILDIEKVLIKIQQSKTIK